MPLKNYYALLDLPPTASADEIKKAFRAQIARYHPDKVHHLGKEFQEMAAERAAELTEAYRILSHEGRRAEYDAALAAAGSAPAANVPHAAPTTAPTAQPEPAKAPPVEPHVHKAQDPQPKESRGPQFSSERATKDEYVRMATIDRFRQAFAQVAGSGYDESPVRGFDIACVPKTKLFIRAKGPRLFGRFVATLDGAAVADAWTQVGKLGLPAGEEICVILMGTNLAPPRELADAIAEQRRRPNRGCKVTVIPVDASIWSAHMPFDAPVVAKDLLTRLRANA